MRVKTIAMKHKQKLDCRLAGKLVTMDIARHNEKFIWEAEASWDVDGEGSFAAWIKREVAKRWRKMVRGN